MSAVPMTQKLVALSLLQECRHPVTADRLDLYMTENHWGDYMLTQQMKSELLEAGFVTCSPGEPHFFAITRAGEEALSLFIDRLPNYLRRQVEVFVRDNRERLLQESTVFTSVTARGSAFSAGLTLYEGQESVMELKLFSPTRQEADRLANRLKEQALSLRQQLLSDGRE